MAKKKSKEDKSKKVGGPFLVAAILCNALTEDSDGVLSASRIVDEFRLTIPHDAPTNVPSRDHPVEVNIFMLVIIRRGDARGGKHNLHLIVENPEGEKVILSKQTIQMPPYPNGTAAAKGRMTLKLRNKGVYWIDVVLGDQILTRMAMNLVVERLEPPLSA